VRTSIPVVAATHWSAPAPLMGKWRSRRSWLPCLVLASFACATFLSVGSFAQADGPLNFGQNYFVRGDFVVAGAQGLNSSFGADGFGTGTIKIPDANPGITGAKSVPAGAEVIAAVLYWQTVEKVGVVPGQPGSGENGFFRPLIQGGPAKGYSITGVPLPNESTVGWSSGGCTGTSTGKLVRTYRANVVSLLPRDSSGNISANGTYEVRLANVGNNTPLTLGATLVLIYRVFDPTVPLNSIVIYDGAFNPGGAQLTMTQTMQGFFGAANHPVSRITHIVAGGKINKFQTVKLNGVTLPSLYGNEPPFPGYYGTWDNPTWTFSSPDILALANFNNPINPGDPSAETQVVPTTSNGGCVSWGAVIIATTVQNTDGDGLLDVWKVPVAPKFNSNQFNSNRPGYCDAAVNGGVCAQGDPNWVDLPGAVLGTSAKPHPDVYVQYDYMCSSPKSDGNTCVTGDGKNYSFNPTLQADPADGNNAMQKVQAVYTGHGFTLHVNDNLPNQPNVHAIQEPVCQDATNNGHLCIFPNPPGTTINIGVVAWPGGVSGFERQLIDKDQPTKVADCVNSPAGEDCVPRFQPAAAPAKHYGLFAHAVGQPRWSLFNGTLVSVMQKGNIVTFTTSTAVGPLNVLNILYKGTNENPVYDPTCPYGRVTVVGAITNPNLDGTFCVNSFNTLGDTFTITLGSSANATYTAGTDPSLAVVPPYTSSQSGIADVGGHHFVVSLGLWGNPAFNGVSPATSPESDGQKPSVIASTLMHEQGHAIFTLAHGGPAAKALSSPQLYQSPQYLSVTTNCKVNYLSVMSYSRQFDVLNYSESALSDIDKAALSGSLSNTDITHWYVPFPAAVNSSGQPIGSAAALLCTGTPPPAGETPMTEVTGPANTFSFTSLNGSNTDINFDGSPYPKTTEDFQGACDWCVGSYDLAQTDATGSYLSSSGPPFGGGGPPFGGGGPPFGGGGPPFGGGGPPFGGGGPPFGGGGPPFGGGGEIDVATANSVTHVPQNLMVTSEIASPRTITLSWTAPFGQIGSYNIYRSADGGKTFTQIASVAAPATTYTEKTPQGNGPTCNPVVGYQYFVTAVLANTNPPQESTPSNTASTILPDTTDPVTGCYIVTGPLAPANAVQGSQVSVTWTLQDDFYPKQGAVTRQATNTLVAIGPLPGSCTTSGRTTLLAAGVPTNGYPAAGTDTFGNSGDVFTFTWNSTDAFCAGSYTLELDLDSGQTPTTSPLQLGIDVNDTDTTPHVATVALNAGTVGLAYTATLTEDGGTAPFKWTITGSLPSGIPQLSLYSPTISGTACTAGPYNFTATVTDSKSNSGSQALTFQINKANTTTGVTSSTNLNTSVFQESVTFTVTVAPQYTCTPTGTVTLFVDGGSIGSKALSGGMATFTTYALSVGMHNITASYGGDFNFNASNSNSAPLVQTVNKASTTITNASASPNPAVVGQSITVAYNFAVAAPGAGAPIAPSGNITVMASDGSVCMAPAAQGPGMCTLVPAASIAGNLTFTVTYTGDSNFLGSGANGNYTVNIYVSGAAAPPFTPVTTLPNGVVGSSYSNTVYESGGVTTGQNNFSWTIMPGSVTPGSGSTLPGIAFQANAGGVTNGTLSGTPTSAGTFTFTALVTDSVGNIGTQNFAITVFAPESAPYGLVSWYPFEGNANDLEKINNGSVVGTPQFVPAEVDNGLKPGPQLNGSLVTIADSPTLALVQFTIGAWVRVDAIDPVESMQIVWKGDNTAGDLTTPYSLSVLGSAANSFGPNLVGTAGPGKVLVILTDGTNELDIVSTNALPLDGKFHYVALTADGQNVSLYIDGAVDPNTPTSEASLTHLPFATANPLQIGGIQGGPAPGNNFDGVIDELQIWNRGLTPSEISGIFNTVGEYQPAARPAGLVSWWPAEGNYADIINANNGTPSGGVRFAPGEVGQAFSFNGVDGEISVADNANLDVSQITIEAWLNPSNLVEGSPILQKGSSDSGGYAFQTTNSPTGPANGLQFVIWIGGAQYTLQTPANVLALNTWQHVAATFDGSTMTIYVNGVQQASSSVSGSIDTDTTDPLVMGLNNGSDWNGSIDEVSLYNRALTSTEIQSIFNAGGAGKAKP